MKKIILFCVFLISTLSHAESAQITVTTAEEFQAALNDEAAANVINISGTIFGRFIVNRSGTTTNPVIIRGGILSGLGVADSDQGLDFALLAVLSQSNIRIENVTFENNFVQSSKGIYVTNATFNDAPIDNVVIDSSYLKNIGWSSDSTADPTSNASGTGQAHGILVTGRTANTITNITISNNTLNNIVSGNSEALTINGNVDGFLVDANTVSDVTNICIDIAGGFGVATSGLDQARNGDVTNNTVFNCRRPTSVSGIFEPAGIYVDGGANITISGNRSYQNGQGFSIGREQVGETTNIVMINNLSYFNAENGLVFGGNNGLVKDSVVRNNTFYQNGLDKPSERSGISVQITENSSITNNLIFEPSDGMFGISYFFGEVSSALVDYNLVNGMSSVFRLANVGDNQNGLDTPPNIDILNDFLPNIGSPVIDSGDSSGVQISEKDATGNVRVIGRSVDIGAREFRNIAWLPVILELLQ